jgi:WD40 repeat protein
LGAVSEDGKFRRWQLLIGREIVSPVTDGMMLSTAAVMASDNIVTGSANGQVIVWAWADSAYQNRSQFNFSSEITKIVVSSDDTFMLVAEANGMVHHVDLTTDTATVSVNFGSHVYDIVLSSDETQFLVAGQQNEIVVWDMAGAEISRIGAHNDWVRSMTFSADGRYLFSVSDDQTLSIWDMVSNAPAHRASLDIRPRSVMIAPDSRSLVIGGAQNNSSTGVLMTWEWQN